MIISGFQMPSMVAAVARPLRQGAAEYVGISAQSALQNLEVLMGRASDWIGDHPAAIWVAVGVLLLLFWGTRGRKI